MADDKTADDDLWLEFVGGSLTDGGRQTFSKVLAKVRAAAARRVAPDRETREQAVAVIVNVLHDNPDAEGEIYDALLASGVLSVPAPDEPGDSTVFDLAWQKISGRDDQWGGCARREEVLAEVERMQAAARGVAPDRETLARELYRLIYPGHVNTHDSQRTRESDAREFDRAYAIWDAGKEGWAPGIRCREFADRLLASGMLGVPAEQRTADRETIARALFGELALLPTFDVIDTKKLADAVLAVLVPADQVRAETLEVLFAEFPPESLIDPRYIWQRAAEYRQAAGA